MRFILLTRAESVFGLAETAVSEPNSNLTQAATAVSPFSGDGQRGRAWRLLAALRHACRTLSADPGDARAHDVARDVQAEEIHTAGSS